MNTGFSDMAQHLALRRHASSLRQSTAVLSEELTTGQVKDQVRHLGGDLTELVAIDKSIARTTSRVTIGQSMATWLSVQQQSVAVLRGHAQAGLDDLMLLQQTPQNEQKERNLASLATRFGDMVNLMNTSFGDRFVFSGTRADAPAVAEADVMLDALMDEIDTASPAITTAQGLGDLIDQWFASGGGFDTIGYLGDAPIPASQPIAPGYSVSISVTAQHEAVRQTFAAFAKGAVLSQGVFEDDPVAQKKFTEIATTAMAGSRSTLIQLAAEIGTSEERVQNANAQNEAERYAMKIARTELLEADPYERATQLERAISQQEMVYSLTARLSRLTLLDFLR